MNFMFAFAALVALSNLGPMRTGPQKSVRVNGMTVSIPSRDTVVDHSVEEMADRKILYLLTRDVDGLIKSYAYHASGFADEDLIGPYVLGYSVDVPAGLEIQSGQIPIRYIESTCPGRAGLAAVAAYGFCRPSWGGRTCYSLYVFRTTASGTYGRIYLRTDVGEILQDLVFRDVDGDCLPELIDVGKSEHVTYANVQIIDKDLTVELVQRIGGAEVDLRVAGPSRFAVEADDSYPGERGLCYVLGYRGWWDPGQRRFKTVFERHSDRPEDRGYRHSTDPTDQSSPQTPQ